VSVWGTTILASSADWFSSLAPVSPSLTGAEPDAPSRISIFQGYVWVLVVAFFTTLIATPIMRKLAVANGVIDRPSEARKVHRMPIAYLGGAAVFLGLMAGIFWSYIAIFVPGMVEFHHINNVTETAAFEGLDPRMVRPSIVLGMMAIVVVGLIDDVTGISPRVKLGGQLFAAAALAIDDVGVNVARGVMGPIGKFFGNEALTWQIPLPFTIPVLNTGVVHLDLIYWTGTALIALFVLGACNASNLIDGLDGLLTGTTTICTAGLLIVALGLALVDDGPRDAQRIVLCMALLGACLGFLPHNFNPATIFLGDAGSLLMGFMTIVIVLTLGDTGKTQLVLAGLIIYAIPLIDTALAIVRRKMAGKSISSADSDHLHHMLKRALGVKGAVLVLYGIGLAFAALGVAISMGRARVTYALTLIFVSYIAVTAIKIARKKQIEEQAAAYDAKAHAIAAAKIAGSLAAEPENSTPNGMSPQAAAAKQASGV